MATHGTGEKIAEIRMRFSDFGGEGRGGVVVVLVCCSAKWKRYVRTCRVPMHWAGSPFFLLNGVNILAGPPNCIDQAREIEDLIPHNYPISRVKRSLK